MQSKRYVPKRGIKRHGISAQEEEKSFPAGDLRKGFPGEGEFSVVPEVCAQIPGTETAASKETA